ncbi:WD40 repeat-like protein [Metschnikowia bicuspidata var. bicuspidata NRRL YB-4993]|uniref:WD40 repeat-like protein n=1 Tax=Metschnikowia bicuspidata var. bicuspidata NRRL YB-4993 TaxID=869754 RepID=A0A1A0HJR3_9ASCO|nr:WD40 repeat-like protein [Metschnikowia bicuspidata var. bicuspidata NRRL YB-4993]OBA24132.1 WD40 repeat-like protein [Metschnikowia bicuspidata var. bicuspidata NRRL YB-4993]
METPRSPSRSTRSLSPPKPGAAGPTYPASALPRRRTNARSMFGDRYIPNRTGIDLQAAFSLSNQDVVPDLRNRRGLHRHAHTGPADGAANEIELRKEEEANRNFSSVLKAELFGDHVPTATADLSQGRDGPPAAGTDLPATVRPANARPTTITASGLGRTTPPPVDPAAAGTPRLKTNLFTYQLPSKARPVSRDLQQELFSLSPVRQESQRFLLSPQKKPRLISKVPYRVLDAPDLSDDFYLNLVDWGSQDVLAVGLGDSVYLWDGLTQLVERLCVLENKDKVTSLSWIGAGTHLALGTLRGLVEIWDATKMKCVRTMTGHKLRVSALAWNEHVLSSGSRDRTIYNRDVRVQSHYINSFHSHKQEVCGLSWNVEENKLASGGNDNNLFIWDALNTKPLHLFTEHNAAVKAIAWSPHQRGILASGGGTADKTIKVWNTLTGNRVHNVETGSQVCNLIWSKNSNEIVSTHGFSRNQIIVWKYPSMQQIAQLRGHTYRVLYLSLSPDGETIVTGAGDETLRFWNVFEKNRNNEPASSVLMDAFLQLR